MINLLPHFTSKHLYFNENNKIIYMGDYITDAFLYLPIELMPKVVSHDIVRVFCFLNWMCIYRTIYHEKWQ